MAKNTPNTHTIILRVVILEKKNYKKSYRRMKNPGHILKDCILYTHTTFLAILTLTRFIPENFYPYTTLVLPHVPRFQKKMIPIPDTTLPEILTPYHFHFTPIPLISKKVDPNINYPYNFCFKIHITHIQNRCYFLNLSRTKKGVIVLGVMNILIP